MCLIHTRDSIYTSLSFILITHDLYAPTWGECYNYRNKEQILYNQEYLDYICIIMNVLIYSLIIYLFLEGIKSLVFIILISFSQYK